MRILCDENFPGPIVEALRAEGNDVSWARIDYPGSKDAVLLEIAEFESRLLLTLDKDFRQIAVQRRIPIQQSGVVLFQVHPATPENIGLLVNAFLDANRDWAGHVSTISRGGILMLST